MGQIDYNKLGLKVGIEIHRQLETNKLFCKCHSILQDKEPDINIERSLRAVISEKGERDIVAEYEMAKRRYAVYEAYSDSTCLVELDESPPENINKHALHIVLEVALLLKCNIVDSVQVMRKQVLDFSNTSGFQRTALVAYDGLVKDVRIQTICLEEDAARKIKEVKDYVVYRLDRLGIPLIEISTYPDINSPQKAKEIAEYLGMILKSTGKVKSGIGTIRQDLNVSIKGGARVEIKGVQELNLIPKIISLEAERQLNLVNQGLKVSPEVRNANLDGTTSFLRPMPGASRMYPETDIPPIKITKNMLAMIKLPELIMEKVINLRKKYSINQDIARQLVKENKLELFNKLLRFNVDPSLIANTLILTVKDIKSRHNLNVNKLKDSDFEFIFKNLSERKISKNAIENILIDIIKGEKIELSKYKELSDEELEKEIKKIIEQNKNANIGALMGIIMAKYRGRVEGKKVMDILKKLLQ